jgi:two-component system, NarL family, sensor kinase
MLFEIAPEKSEFSDKIISQLASLHEETRRISHNLSPLKLQEEGLIKALRSFCVENSNVDFQIHFYAQEDTLSLQEDVERILYRIIQELIQNVIKHAEAKNCSVQIKTENNKISIFIEDDGKGFDLNSVAKNQGLESIKQRIAF